MSTTDDEAAVSYYEAAQRRLGCLGTSLTDIQCFYFASLFEKFAFRPVQSWMHLQQAATRLRLHHMERANEASDLHVGGSDNGETDASQSNISFHFEQRAFWSIHKAERYDMMHSLMIFAINDRRMLTRWLLMLAGNLRQSSASLWRVILRVSTTQQPFRLLLRCWTS